MILSGAKKVYAVDVGHGQLAEKLRNDGRVVNLEGTDIRELSLSEMERHEFYQPLNDDEILDFRDGLCDLLMNKTNYLYSMDVQATFELANERAEEIERESKSDREIE